MLESVKICTFRFTTVLPFYQMINYTIRPVLWLHKKNKHGLFPLMIALTIKRKVRYIATNFKLKENQWSEGSIINYQNSMAANAVLRKQIAEIEKDLLSREMAGENISLKTKNGSFEAFAKEVKGDTIANRKEIYRLKAFSSNINLTEINVNFLRRYEQNERGRGMSPNTVNTTFKWLRRIINQAYQEKLITQNPFDEYAVPKYIQTDRTYLVESEKKELLKLLPKVKGEMYNTLCYFLLGCYSGLRHQDWKHFNKDKVENGFLKLRALKNKQMVVLPIGPTLAKIIKRVLKCPPPLSQAKSNIYLKAIGSAAKLKKNLTNHVSRHSFACMCAAKGLPRSVTAELMGISEDVVKVYYHLEGIDIAKQAAALKEV